MLLPPVRPSVPGNPAVHMRIAIFLVPIPHILSLGRYVFRWRLSHRMPLQVTQYFPTLTTAARLHDGCGCSI